MSEGIVHQLLSAFFQRNPAQRIKIRRELNGSLTAIDTNTGRKIASSFSAEELDDKIDDFLAGLEGD